MAKTLKEKSLEKRANKAECLKLYIKHGHKIPINVVNLVLAEHPDWKVSRIQNVSLGRRHDLEDLKEVLRICKIIK